MSESTYKSGRKKGFVVLYRAAAQDARLTLEARGLFAMMVSLPDNWEYTVSGLAAKAGCGKDKIRRLLKELQDVGYLMREQGHDQGGKFAGNVYVLQDEAPLSGNTDNGDSRQRSEPSTGKPSPVFTTQKNKEEKNPDSKEPPKAPQGAAEGEKPKRARRAKSVPVWQAEKFEGFWKAYPRDEDRAKAVKEWDKLPQDRELMQYHGGSEDALLLAISRGLKRHLESRAWKEDVGIPYAFRWLRDRRWTEKSKQRPPEASLFASPPPPPEPRTFHTEIVNGEEVVIYDERDRG